MRLKKKKNFYSIYSIFRLQDFLLTNINILIQTYIFLISNKQDAYQLFLTLWNTELWTLSALRPIKDLAQRRHSYTK